MNIDMTPNLMLVLVIGVLVGCGVYLLLERSLSRVIIGIALIGNGVNLLILMMGGSAGDPPLLGSDNHEDMADGLPQAMILTAIVITFGFVAFMLAMAYRSWKLNGHDEVQDDLEDRRLAERAIEMEHEPEEVIDLDDEALEARDETEEAPQDISEQVPGRDTGIPQDLKLPDDPDRQVTYNTEPNLGAGSEDHIEDSVEPEIPERHQADRGEDIDR